MNNFPQQTKNKSKLDQHWQTMLEVKSELDSLVVEVDELRVALEAKVARMRSKIRLLNALREQLLEGAEDTVPEELTNDVAAVARSTRKSIAHDVVRRVLSREKCGVETAELIKSPDVQSIGIEPKAIYNVLNYLATRGEVERVSRGRYRLISAGCAIESIVEIEDLEDRSKE